MDKEIIETKVEANMDDALPMKENLLKMVEALKAEGYDLSETPAIFQWAYEEKPFVMFQIVIGEIPTEVPAGETVQ